MLDHEDAIFTVIARKLREKFNGIKVYGEEVESPAGFPCVTFVQAENSTYRRSLTGDGKEYHTSVMFVANAYSNLSATAKQQCKEMIELIDDYMRMFGFVRVMDEPLPNYERSISRRTARWTGVIGADGFVYRA